MDYSEYNYKYQLYLESVERNQSDIIRYASECACLESADIIGIKSINESAVDSVKNSIKKIMQAISSMWKKFIERVNEVITFDNTYLEKYKDIILHKPPKSKEITMYDYDHDALKIQVPEFTYDERIKKWLALEDPGEEFVSTFLTGSNLDQEMDIKEAMQERIRGANQIEKDGKGLPMDKYYNFCVNYKSTIEQLKKDKITIEKSQSAIDKILGQYKPPVKDEDKEETPVESNDADKVSSESMIYSNVYGRYITEGNSIKIGKAKKDDKEQSSGSGASSSKSEVDNGVGKGMGINKKVTANVTTDMNSKTEEEYKKLAENAPVFFKCCGDMVAGKLTVCQEMKKNYMAIIKAHVRDYVGDKD